jgi:hypothetical protein
MASAMENFHPEARILLEKNLNFALGVDAVVQVSHVRFPLLQFWFELIGCGDYERIKQLGVSWRLFCALASYDSLSVNFPNTRNRFAAHLGEQ